MHKVSIVGAVVALSACVTHGGGWNMQASATSGAAIVYATAGGDEVRIACRRNPSDLMVHAGSFRAEPGIADLVIRSAAYGIVLPLAPADGGEGVTAAGPVPDTIYDLLGNGAPMALQYGKQALAAPPLAPANRAAFLAACRASQ